MNSYPHLLLLILITKCIIEQFREITKQNSIHFIDANSNWAIGNGGP